MDKKEVEYLNTGVLLEPPKPEDWSVGGISGISYESLCDDWRPYLPSYERQKKWFDTMGCVSFSDNNVLETLLNFYYKTGRMPVATIAWAGSKGYIGADDKFNLSDRYLAKMSGTTKGGNSLNNVAQTVHEVGIVPESVYPFPDNYTWDEYYAIVPQSIIDLGAESLEYFGFLYEWVGTSPDTNTTQHLTYHLKQSPLQLATAICGGWSTDDPVQACTKAVSHATMLYGIASDGDREILDHYEPFEKDLAADYPINYAMKFAIQFKTPDMIDRTTKYYAQARSTVLAMYRILLGREPETTQVLDQHAYFLAKAWQSGIQSKVEDFYAGFIPEITTKYSND